MRSKEIYKLYKDSVREREKLAQRVAKEGYSKSGVGACGFFGILRFSMLMHYHPLLCIFALFPKIKLTVRELGTTHLVLQNSLLLLLVSMTQVIQKRTKKRTNACFRRAKCAVGCFVSPSFCTCFLLLPPFWCRPYGIYVCQRNRLIYMNGSV